MTVKEENEWIEEEFDCNITKPFIIMKEIELMEMGFKIQKDIPEEHTPIDPKRIDTIIG